MEYLRLKFGNPYISQGMVDVLFRKKIVECVAVNESTSKHHIDLTRFLDELNKNIDSLLIAGSDKEGIPYFTTVRPCMPHVDICLHCQRFDYITNNSKAILRFKKEDQLLGRMYITDIFTSQVYNHLGIGSALMISIIKYAKDQGINYLEGEQWMQKKLGIEIVNMVFIQNLALKFSLLHQKRNVTKFG